ncbi:hypothetical protein B0T16DRAFT_219550 [Cercophora newfieldiana]|uniref:Uncharacterized protein n=1 Tax=Cercophora newfieldiana TaxID=92897 RepID=A0AA39XX35_9PEZI|nr:hypothetical protein B0T16DRAFT_219550 [Cercophora newfieldiana]
MWPLLLLLVALESTAMLHGWSALTLPFFALGDPLGTFHDLLSRMRHKSLCKEAGANLTRFLGERRGGNDQHLDTKTSQSLQDAFATMLSVMSDIIGDFDSAKGALRQALRQSQLSNEGKGQAIIDAAEAVHSLAHSRGAAAAWIAVIICIVDLLFLIIAPLKQRSLEQPSGAKIASAAAFSWLLPMVLLHAYYGGNLDQRKSAKEIRAMLKVLEGGQDSSSEGATEE